MIHPITNLSYTIDGDTATGGAYWQDVGLVNGAPGGHPPNAEHWLGMIISPSDALDPNVIER